MSSRRLRASRAAAWPGFGSSNPSTLTAPCTTVSPLSVSTLRAPSSVSVLRNSSTNKAFSSTFLMPAFAQPFERTPIAGRRRRVRVHAERHLAFRRGWRLERQERTNPPLPHRSEHRAALPSSSSGSSGCDGRVEPAITTQDDATATRRCSHEDPVRGSAASAGACRWRQRSHSSPPAGSSLHQARRHRPTACRVWARCRLRSSAHL